MNRMHRVLWNAARGALVVANERAGSSQAHGRRAGSVAKGAAALAAAAMLAAGSASAAVENGVLTTSGDETVVFFGTPDENGRIPEVGLEEGQYAVETAVNPVLSGIAENIKTVYLTQGNGLSFVGENLDVNVSVRFWDRASNTTDVTIGSVDAPKTTGNFAEIFVNCWTDANPHEADSTSHLFVRNADVRIENLRVADTPSQTAIEVGGLDPTLVIASDSKLSVGAFSMVGAHVSNAGTLVIDAWSSQTATDRVSNEEYWSSAPSVVENLKGASVQVGSGLAPVLFLNDGTVTATGDLSLLAGGVNDQDPTRGDRNKNRGTMTVAGTLTLGGLTRWGTGPEMYPNLPGMPMIGRLENAGTLEAQNVVVNGVLENLAGGKITVANSFTIETPERTDGVVVPDYLQATVRNDTDAAMKIGGELRLTNGDLVNSGTITAHHVVISGGILTNEAGGTLEGTYGFSWTTQGETVNNGTIRALNGMTIDATNGDFVNAGSIELSNDHTVSLAGAFRNKGTLADGHFRLQKDASFAVEGGQTRLSALFGTAGGNAVTVDKEQSLTIGTFQIGNGAKAVIDGTVNAEQFAAWLETDITGNGTFNVQNGLALSEGATMNLQSADVGALQMLTATATFQTIGIGYATNDAPSESWLRGTLTADSIHFDNFGYAELSGNTTANDETLIGTNFSVVTTDGTSRFGDLTLAGVLEVRGGNVYADTFEFSESNAGLLVVKSDTDVGTLNGVNGRIEIHDGDLNVETLGSTDGLEIVYKGAGELAAESGRVENATFVFQNQNRIATEGFGRNAVVLENSTLTLDVALTSETAMTVGTGSTLNAAELSLDKEGGKTLILDGGTLSTSLNQIFSSVSSNAPVIGMDPETGETVEFPTNGISSVGAVKDEIASGIDYREGVFQFTDDGWTLAAVNAAVGSLGTAFGAEFEAGVTIDFSGTKEEGDDGFTVSDANNLTHNVVLSGTDLLNGAEGIVFGETLSVGEGNLVVNEVTGFRSILETQSVTVRDGRHLYLVGFEGDEGTRSVLPDAQNGGKAAVETGSTLTLGLSGSKTGGLLGTADVKGGMLEVASGGTFVGTNVSFESGKMLVNQGASFTIDSMTLTAGNNTIENNGTLVVKGFVDQPLVSTKFTNNGTATIGTSAGELELHGDIFNNGNLTIASDSIEIEGLLANAGTVTANELVVYGGSNSEKGEISATYLGLIVADSFENAGTIEGIREIDVGGLSTDHVFTNKAGGTISAPLIKVSVERFENAGMISGETLKIEQSTDKFENAGTIDVGAMTTSDVFTQTEAGIAKIGTLTLSGDKFDGTGGTWIVKEVKGETEGASVSINLANVKEFVTADASVDNTTYAVGSTGTLAFGEKNGLRDTLSDEWVANAKGTLIIDRSVDVAESGSISVGAGDDVSTLSDNRFVAEKDSVTIFTGNAFGADGTSAGITGNGSAAVIADGAKAVLTNVQTSGTYTLLEGFDLSQNLDASGNWIGGWTDEDGKYVTVDNGSDLDWKAVVSYDKESESIVAELEAADVSTVYDFSIKDIANAALATDASKGGDAAFLQAVINNKTLDVHQTEKIVNSVAQIDASLGAVANFVNDVSNLADAVESRTSLLSKGKASGLWVRAEGGKYEMDGLKLDTGMDAGYDADVYGFTFGADTFVRPDFRVGAAFSYLKGEADAEGDVLSGQNEYDTFGLQAYASYDLRKDVRVSGEIGWFRTSGDLTQRIAYANVREATAEADSDAFVFGIRGEHRFDLSGVTVVPHVGLRGLYVMNDDFRTKVDGRDAFKNDRDDTFTFQMPIGVAVEKAFAAGSGWTVVPSADFTVTPQFGDTDYETTVTGVGTGVSNTVTADMAGDVTGRLTLGVKGEKDAVGFGAYYGLTAGDAGRTDHAFSVNFSYRF